MDRLAALRGDIAGRRLSGLLVTGSASVQYLSGFSGSSGWLLLEPHAATLFTDFRYETQAATEVGGGVDLVILKDAGWAALAERLATSPPGRPFGFEASQLSVADHEQLARACGNVIWEPVAGMVEARRAVKDDAELASIEAAVDLADLVYERLIEDIRLGQTEQDVAARLVFLLRANGSGPLPFEPIVAFGERSALPHAAPTERVLRAGDLVLLDFGARVDGYCSDMTRVLVAGRAADWQRELHGHVLDACRSAIGIVAEGVPAATVDAAARDLLGEAGLAERFGHSTGHGVGLDVHEAPRLHRKVPEPLRAGNVVTVEPGVYLPGQGGIRIEQMVAVVADGARELTRSSLELIEL